MKDNSFNPEVCSFRAKSKARIVKSTDGRNKLQVSKKGIVIYMDYENEKLPIAFSVALAHNSDALKYFSSLPKEGRDRIIEQTWPMNSKAEMYDFVELLAAEGRNQITQ